MSCQPEPLEVSPEAIRAVESEYERTLRFPLKIGDYLKSEGLIRIKERENE